MSLRRTAGQALPGVIGLFETNRATHTGGLPGE
jgi:hypothetical protein